MSALAAQRTQNHHYVPQFLLRPWCTLDESGAEKLWACRRLPTGKLHHTRYAPRSTGYVTDLYKLEPPIVGASHGPGEKPYAVEEHYSRLESAATGVRDKLLAGTPPSALAADERQTWAEFIGTLEHRNPRQVRKAEAAGISMKEQLREEHRQRFGDPAYADEIFDAIDVDTVAKNAARTTVLVNRQRLAEPIAEWQWVIATVPAFDLITADYPIANLLHDGKGAALMLPLSPNVLFIAAACRLTEDVGRLLVLATNLALIEQKPNFIYSKTKLADGEVFRLLKAADDTLDVPEEF